MINDLEALGRLVIMLMIIGSGILIVYVNIKENPYISKDTKASEDSKKEKK